MVGLQAPKHSLLPWGSLELTHRGSQLLQECEHGGDEVCGILRPDGAVAAEPEHPAGELGRPGGSTLSLEPGLLAPTYPHLPTLESSPSASTWPPKVQTAQLGQGLGTFPWRKADSREPRESPSQRGPSHPTRYTHNKESLPEMPPETGSPQKDPCGARGLGVGLWSCF